jgi:hypothetical protein
MDNLHKHRTAPKGVWQHIHHSWFTDGEHVQDEKIYVDGSTPAPKESGWRELRVCHKQGVHTCRLGSIHLNERENGILQTYLKELEATAIAATEAREREAHKEAMGEMVREILELTYEKDETYEDRPSHMKTYGEAMGEMHQSIKAIARSRGVLDDNKQ